MFGSIVRASTLALVVALPTFNAASAGTVYDGSWSLTIATKRGTCDPSYNFNVQIDNGVVSHANLVRLKGRVVSGGAVRVSVAVPGKYAAGSGKLTRTAGTGRWRGYSGDARCSGSWTAQKL